MTDVLHAAWLPFRELLFVWGETDLAKTVRVSGDVPPHPFQSNLLPLRATFEQVCGQVGKGATETIWLPAIGGIPLASPELRSPAEHPTGDPVLTAFRVKGRLFSVEAALFLLTSFPADRLTGADWRALRKACLLALEAVQAQEVYPTVEREGYRVRARWQLLPGSGIEERIDFLVAALPPVARAAASELSGLPSARRVVESLVAVVVDRQVRLTTNDAEDTVTKPAMYPYHGGKEWLRALGSLATDHFWGYTEVLLGAFEKWAAKLKKVHDDPLRLTFRLEPPERDDLPWRLSYFLQPRDDPGLIVPAAELWNRESDAAWLFSRADRPVERYLNSLIAAARRFPPIEASLNRRMPEDVELTADQAFEFLKDAAGKLRDGGFGVQVPAWWSAKPAWLKARARARTQVGETNSSGLFSFEKLVDFDWKLTLNGDPINPEEFNRLADLKVPLVQHRGEWIVLDPVTVAAGVRFLKKESRPFSFGEFLRYGLDPTGMSDGIEIEEIDPEGWLREVLERLGGEELVPGEPLPKGLIAEMRPYQSRGYEWLAFLRRYGLGACLADDMGLGKTVQTIALLLKERDAGQTAPALVVCPTSVVSNWKHELARFAPDLRVAVHHGADRHRKGEFSEIAAQHDVILTSYSLLLRDTEALRSVGWSTVVLDEAQNIKNASTKQAQVARSLPAGFRVALSGTPVENRLSDLWSIMGFLNPGYLGSEESFNREFARPIEKANDQEAVQRLRRLTGGFILRRLKTDPAIIADLPEKLEAKVYCPLTREQATLYEAVVREALQSIEGDDTGGIQRRGKVLAMLTKLKQVTNHPALFLQDGSALPGRSGKLDRLDEMVDEPIDNGKRALIFTQFSTMGELLQKHISRVRDREVLFLHGGTPAKAREKMVERFQSPGGPPIFVLSLKAGGIGLNLTAASTVFHFDRWWNPAVENQATDRAFRIGQTKNVQVYKFICSGTLEERIDTLIESKRSLAENVIGAGEQWLTELSTSELRDLVRLRREDVVGGRR